MASPDPPRTSLLRRTWRLFKWLALSFFLVVLVLGVFHRPIILWALNRFGPDAAKMGGVSLAWKVDGSLWSDLKISAIQVEGLDDKLPLKSLSAGRVELNYDLSPLWKKDYFSVAKAVTLHDVTATLDLSKPSPPATKSAEPTDFKAIGELLKKIRLPGIDIQNVNLTVLLPDAKVVITDLDLSLPIGKTGALHIGSVEHPALKFYPLREITAGLVVTPEKIEVTQLKLPPRLEVTSLVADAGLLEEGKVAAVGEIQSGAGTIRLNAGADISGESPLIDALIGVQNFSEKDAAAWLGTTIPAQAKLEMFFVKATGDVMKPRALEAEVNVHVTGIKYEAYAAEEVKVQARLTNGVLDLQRLLASAGGNRVEATTQLELPSEWADVMKSSAQVKWKLDAPALEKIAGVPIKVTGAIQGSGAVDVAGTTLKRFDAELSAAGLGVDGRKLHSLKASAHGDLKSIAFDTDARAEVGDGVLLAKGNIGLAPGSKSHAEWNIAVPRPGALVRSLKVMEWPEDVTIGEVKTEGSLDFDLLKIMAVDLDHAVGRGSLNVANASWKSAPCEDVSAEWNLTGGKATLTKLDVQLPGANTAHVSADVALAGDMAFTAALDVGLKEIAALKPWLTAGGVAGLQGGALALAWKGSGKVKNGLAVSGQAEVKADAVAYDALPGLAAASISATHDLQSAELKEVIASVGPWGASLKGKVGMTSAEVSDLVVKHGERQLLVGSLQVPLDLAAVPVPVDPKRPLNVEIKMPQKLAIADLMKMSPVPAPPAVAALTGDVNLRIAASGLLPQLGAEVTFDGTDLLLPGTPITERGVVGVKATLKEGKLVADAVASVKPLEPINAHVDSAVDVMGLITKKVDPMKLPINATVALKQPSLAFLKDMVPLIAEINGSLLVDAKVQGTPSAPKIYGVVDLNVPALEPVDPVMPFVKDLKARITGDDKLVKIESLRTLASGGEVTVTGTCGIADFANPLLDLTLTARDFPLMRDAMVSMRTDADITCKGPLAAAAVAGTVSLTRGRVMGEVDMLPVGKMMNELPPLPAGPPGPELPELVASYVPPIVKNWKLDVAVKTKDDIRLLGNVVGGNVKVDIKAGGTAGAMTLAGQVSAEQTKLHLPFSTLRVRKGLVIFTPEKSFEPTLDLHAEALVDEYEVDLRGHGSALDPKLRFSSSPPLSEGDIAVLLATGSTTNGLKTSGQDFAGRAILFLLREGYRRVFGSKPKKPGEKESESRFIVQERSENGSLGGVVGIYEFNRKMKVVGSTDKYGGFRAMLHYLFRFK